MKNPQSFPSRRHFLSMSAVVFAALVTGSTLVYSQDQAAAKSGPTPFPDSHNEAAWKGTGPIRVFPWMTDNRNYFWTQRDQKQGAVVFVGDSLLGNWSLAKVKTEQAFPKLKNVANRAIGGDVSRGVLFRLQEDVLDLHPEAVVLMIGTNDLSAKAPVEGVISNINEILDEAQKEYPDMPIILCKIPPRNSTAAVIDPAEVTKLNDQIAQVAQARKNVTLFDAFTVMATPDGQPDPVNFKKDLLHPSDVGYEKMGSGLSDIFAQLKLQ